MNKTDTALTGLGAREAAALIADGKLTSVELAEACLARSHELDPTLRAWSYLDDELVLETAARFDERRVRGEDTGPFHGVPLGVKDIFNTSRMPTEMGSPIWNDFTPGNDARVVETLRWHGCYPMGKTVTAEFGVHHPGPTLNPYDTTRSPGTSSSGSAVAVATGMVPVALGSQTAGSTIRPASYCGIYGFKPSFGLMPRTGVLKTTDTLDHVTLFARAVKDIVLLFDNARVSGRNYPVVERNLDGTTGGARRGSWRLGLVRGPKWADAEEYARDALERFAEEVGRLRGVTLEEVVLPAEFSRVHDVHDTIYSKAVSYYFGEELNQLPLVSPIFQEMAERGRKITREAYEGALRSQASATMRLDGLFGELDAILTLAAGGEALPGLAGPDRPDNCLVWTFCGVPALSVPAFAGPDGLPFGAQLVSRKYNDYRLLELAQLLVDEGLVPAAPYPAIPEHPGAGSGA